MILSDISLDYTFHIMSWPTFPSCFYRKSHFQFDFIVINEINNKSL